MSRHLAVRLEGLVFSYRLSEVEIERELAQFGKVSEVMLLDEELAPDVAIVEFVSAHAAQRAVVALEGAQRTIEGFHGITVRAALLSPEIERELLAKAHILADGTDPFDSNNAYKFTCRYVIGAEKMHPEYSVIGRLVGVGGDNVKSIFRATGCNVRCNGKQKSAEDPLHVRVAANNKEAFEAGKQLTEKLIQEMFDDFAKWCERHYLPVPAIRLKVVEGSDVLRPLGRLIQHHFP